LRCFLKHGLSDGALEEAKPAKRKPKKTEDGEPSARSSSSKKRNTKTSIEDVQDGCVENHQIARPEEQDNTVLKKRRKSKKQPQTQHVKIL
jgi:hypothetical protein